MFSFARPSALACYTLAFRPSRNLTRAPSRRERSNELRPAKMPPGRYGPRYVHLRHLRGKSPRAKFGKKRRKSKLTFSPGNPAPTHSRRCRRYRSHRAQAAKGIFDYVSIDQRCAKLRELRTRERQIRKLNPDTFSVLRCRSRH